MQGRQLARDGQAEPRALRGASADEGFEQPLGQALRDARSVVGDAHDAEAFLAASGDRDDAASPLLGRSGGIAFDGLDRSIDARISRLRRKLGDNPEQPERIKTVRGRGYLFSRSAWG